MTIALKKKVFILLLSLGIVMIFGGLYITFKTKKAFDRSVFWAEHTHEVISETQHVLSVLQDIQLGGRGYVITGDSTFLEPINHSTNSISIAIQKLKTLTIDNPYQGPRIDSVDRMARATIDYVDKYISIREKKGFSEASTILSNKAGKRELDSIRHELYRIQKVEYKLLELRKDKSQKNIKAFYIIFISLLGSLVLLLVGIFFTTRVDINMQSKAEKTSSLYESIISASEDAIISKGLDGIIKSWNHGAENLFGYSKEEILGSHISILIPKYNQNEEIKIIEQIKQNISVKHYDTTRLRKDGSVVHISLAVSPIKDSSGNVVGASKIARDITKGKTDEETLSRSLRDISDYKYALDESAIVAITDQRGIIKHVNENFCKISKYSVEELIGQDHRIVNSGYHTKEFIRDLWVTIASGKIWNGELKNKAKDGATYWVDTTIVPFLNEHGKPYQYVAIRADITGRKLNEEALAKSLRDIADYKYALDESAIVAITDQRGIIKHVNENFCKISKYSVEELIGQDHRIINSGYHSKEFIRDLWITITNGEIWKGELKNRAKDGATYWVDTTIVPFLNELGKPYQYVAIRADITDRKRAEEENERKEIRFRNTLDKMLEGVEIIDFDFRYLYVNDAYEKQVKHTKEELLGYTVMEKFPGIENTEIFKSIIRCFDERIQLHLEDKFTFSDGTTTWFEISFQPVPEGVFILSIDITQKKQVEERIRQSELRFRSLIENSYDIVSISDENFRPIYRSPASLRITGWTNDDRDQNKSGAVDQTHPDDIGQLRSTMKDVLNNPGISFAVSFRTRHKDGHYISLEGMITNMLHAEPIKGIVGNFRDVTETRKAEEKIRESEKIYKTIASSIPGSVICLFDKDYRYFLIEGDILESLGYSKEKLLGNKIYDVLPPDRLKDVLPNFLRVFNGESFVVESFRSGFDILTRYVPLKDENHSVFAAMLVVFDVSELKKSQRALAELNVGLEQKIKTRTLELEMVNKDLEAFSYSVAHDLRTPLRAINGYATMLDEDYCHKLDDEGKRLIDATKYNAKRMGTLIDDLLTFSRLGRKEIKKSHIDMKLLTESSLIDLHLDERYPGKIEINNLHPIMADFSLIKHVMINLLSNAIKYSSKKENPLIEISSWEENEKIIYSIADNGAGFDMEYANKLFGVFQRLHSADEFDGTGVGLAIVQRIIHRHEGEIWAEGKVDKGATFNFSLPMIQGVS